MKTIKFLADSINLMKANGTPANITVGTFEIKAKGDLHYWAGRTGTFDYYTLSFKIEFRPDHIQHLIDLGVNLDFNTVASSIGRGSAYYLEGREAIKVGRYYTRGGGRSENWLTASATCDITTLLKLDRVCRDNHLDQISIDNDTCTGWAKKSYSFAEPKKTLFYKKVRKNIAVKSKKHANLLPVEKQALNQFTS